MSNLVRFYIAAEINHDVFVQPNFDEWTEARLLEKVDS